MLKSRKFLCLVIVDYLQIKTNTYNNRDLEIVPFFSYLGITFSTSGSFNAAKKDLVNKGTKAMYEVLKKGRLHRGGSRISS